MELLSNILSETRYVEDDNAYSFIERSGNIPFKYFNYNGVLKTFSYVSLQKIYV